MGCFGGPLRMTPQQRDRKRGKDVTPAGLRAGLATAWRGRSCMDRRQAATLPFQKTAINLALEMVATGADCN